MYNLLENPLLNLLQEKENLFEHVTSVHTQLH